MTVEQTTIFGAGRTLVDGKPLTPRQQAAFDFVRHASYGAATVEVGCNWHALRGKHSGEQVCDWCERDGLHVLRSKALHGLVIRKRATGRFYCLDPKDALVDQAVAPATSAHEKPERSYPPLVEEIPF